MSLTSLASIRKTLPENLGVEEGFLVTVPAEKSGSDMDLYFNVRKPEGEAKAVVILVHGLGEHVRRYDHVVAAFNSNGFGVVSFDQRGYGRSVKLNKTSVMGYDGGMKTVLADIDVAVSVAQEEFPGVKKFIYSHSMGAFRAIVYHSSRCDRDDVAGAIFSAPFAGLDKNAPFGLRLKVFVGKLLASLLPTTNTDAGLDLSGISRDPAVIEKYKTDPYVHPYLSLRSGSDMFAYADKLWAGDANKVRVPFLMVHGTADRLTSPIMSKGLFEKMTGSTDKTYQEFEGAYHELHNEPNGLSEQVIQLYVDWITKHL